MVVRLIVARALEHEALLRMYFDQAGLYIPFMTG